MLIACRQIYQGRVVRLNVETVQLPNGHRTDLEIVHHPGGAAIAAIDAQGRVCLLRQFRHAAQGWVWELPAGKLEPDEAPAATAVRELAEEAGVAAARWQPLGVFLSSPGVLTERLHLFAAMELSPAAGIPEQGEVFEVHWVPLEAAIERVHAGDIVDAKTCIGLFRLQRLLAGR